ncbi:pulmonary surfactant-associated protein A-like isoform X5 [Oxyura jamaicensis]|uniref:pulmonary surfactant-associated protein A-like isoform X5 n=1 Tax=Oxyura jamaicensis TaxID=8884 RepID=UPI0015A709B9|nr:pulmonary surfactant-associated protein A-like isoform X5 [Oxyura jamaicensis]
MLSQQMFHRILAVALFLLPYCARGFKSLPGKEMGDVILQLEDRISKLERVLHLEGIITASEGKIFATDGKTADFHATVKKCAEAGGSIATPRNAGENDAILYFVKHFNNVSRTRQPTHGLMPCGTWCGRKCTGAKMIQCPWSLLTPA